MFFILSLKVSFMISVNQSIYDLKWENYSIQFHEEITALEMQ